MGVVGFFMVVIGWIWSVARGIQVSMLCVVLNFVFPPVAQGIFSIYEPTVPAPLMLMLAGMAVLYLNGNLSLG